MELSAEILASELGVLRSAAGMVARGASPREVLETVACHVASAVDANFSEILQFAGHVRPEVIAAWSASADKLVDLNSWSLADDDIARRILETRAPLRVQGQDVVSNPTSNVTRERFGVTCSVGVPILLDGSVWGAVFVHSTADQALPTVTESCLMSVTPLIASVIASSRDRAAFEEIAANQDALFRVAELVARGASPDEVFASVAEKLGRLVKVNGAKMCRYEIDETATFVASWGELEAGIPAGMRLSTRGDSVTCQIRRTGAPARVDNFGLAEGDIATVQRTAGMTSAVGVPINVGGCLWGALIVGTVGRRPLPLDTEQRMSGFAELVAIALSNLEARTALQGLADEQAALRRVATVVAREEWTVTLPTIVREVGQLLAVDGAVLLRFEDDEIATILTVWGAPDLTRYVNRKESFRGDNPVAYVWRTHRPARQQGFDGCEGYMAETSRENGITSSVATPVIVENHLWGAMVVYSTAVEPLPATTERRVAQFAELVATAIGNMKSRLELMESRARIVRTADDVRRRFERDLHDGIQQRLVSTAMHVSSVETSLASGSNQPRAELRAVAEELSDVLEQLRELSRGLHPAILSDDGLAPALRSLARRCSVPVDLHLGNIPRLPGPIEVAAYYVVSEALANISKHSAGSRACIRVDHLKRVLRVTVSDDGVGGADAALGSGLTGLEDRVDALGGSLTVHSPLARGTRITARFPSPGS